MRVIDFGLVSGLRSQTLWHALARVARPGDRPTLSFTRPANPYVCLGYHRDIAEVDTDYCAAAGLPVYRRMVGGGPVYLDSGQVFFQVVVPVADLPARRADALAAVLRPAAAALRDVGVDAELDRYGEISVNGAKVCGHGAGQIGDGAAIVGNLITAFDHDRAGRVLRLSPALHGQVVELMRRYVRATPVEPVAWRSALIARYAEHFGAAAEPGGMTGTERAQLVRMDARLGGADFVTGRPRPARAVRTVKVRAGVWAHEWSADGTASDARGDTGHLVLAAAGGVVVGAAGQRGGLRGGDLVGRPLDELRSELERDAGTAALAAALRSADTEVMAA